MSTFHNLILSLERENLSNHELAFLAAHCVIIDHGLQLYIKDITPGDFSESQANSIPKEDYEIQATCTGPFVKRQDGSINIVILPPKWNLTDTSKQAYSVNYSSPLKSINQYQGPKVLSFRAIVIADKIIFHLTESKHPETLISFEISLSSKNLTNLIKFLKKSPLTEKEVDLTESVYMELYEKIHPHLNHSNEITITTTGETTTTSSLNQNPQITRERVNVPISPFPVIRSNIRDPSELIGPDHPAFAIRNRRLRRPPGVNIDPLDPLSGSGYSGLEDDGMPRLGGSRDPFF